MKILRTLLLGTALSATLALPVMAQDVVAVLSQNEVGATSYNPITATLLSVGAWLLYDRLVSKDENLQYVPNLAESWEEAADGMAWTFNLKPGVTFHNGTAFNAQTIVDWLPLYKGTENGYLFDAIDHAEVISENTVKFVMKRPEPNLLYNLSTVYASIPDPATFTALGEDFGVTEVVGGPLLEVTHTITCADARQGVITVALDLPGGMREVTMHATFRPEAGGTSEGNFI